MASFSKSKVVLFCLSGYDQAIISDGNEQLDQKDGNNPILIYDDAKENIYILQHISVSGLEISSLKQG